MLSISFVVIKPYLVTKRISVYASRDVLFFPVVCFFPENYCISFISFVSPDSFAYGLDDPSFSVMLDPGKETVCKQQ